MSLIINHNLMAVNSARHLNQHFGALGSSTQRLSSGLRINSSSDDAAGLAIREMQRADITALRQGARNANDAISMVQTADGALSIIDEKLIRMKELAEQAATGTYDSTQRLMIDSEFQAMAAEIDRIANATDFNGIHLLNGNLSGAHNGSGLNATGALKVHFGTGNESAEDYYYVQIDGARVEDLFDLGAGAGSASGMVSGAAMSNEITGELVPVTSDVLLGPVGGVMPPFRVSTVMDNGIMAYLPNENTVSFSDPITGNAAVDPDTGLPLPNYTLKTVPSATVLSSSITKTDYGCAVVWSQNTAGNYALFAQRFDNMGTPLNNPPITLRPPSAGFFLPASIDGLAGGGFAVGLMESGSGNAVTYIVDNAGTITKNTLGTSSGSPVTATGLTNGRIVQTWGTGTQINGVITDSDGVSSPIIVYPPVPNNTWYCVTALQDGSSGFAIPSLTIPATNGSLYIFNADGTLRAQSQLNLQQQYVNNLSATSLPTGHIVVTWEESNPGIANYNIYGQILNPDGSTAIDTFKVNDNVTDARYSYVSPSYGAGNTMNGFTITYYHYPYVGAGKIYARTFDLPLVEIEEAEFNIRTQDNAQKMLERIDSAIVKKDASRARLGAIQNRLENTISNLEIQAENLQAAESRISDVDAATEMTEFTKEQILSQAATAMLAQANSLPKMALQVIGG